MLNGGDRVAILVDIGARGAGALVEQAAEKFGAPVVKSLLGKMVLPDDSPHVTGGLGLLSTKPSEELMEEADRLLMLGTNFPYTKFLPEPGQAEVVQVEIDPARAGTRISTDVPLVGDVAATLEALIPLLEPRKGSIASTLFKDKIQQMRG